MNLQLYSFASKPRGTRRGRRMGPVVGMAALLAASSAAWAVDTTPSSCSARSATTTARVIELYTSEGCNSCPPADRWLSRLAPEMAKNPDAVALAFHVDYWDRLGWKDRFASAAYTSRQSQQQASNGAKFSYTPQVVLDGLDNKDWPRTRLPLKATTPAQVQISMTRDGKQFNAAVAPMAGGPTRLVAYWAVTELNHATSVRAGENEGVTLKHDFVVREYETIPPWSAKPDVPTLLSFTPNTPSDINHARQVNLVVVDADTGRPVQALKLGC